ncbi:hypothetical protein J7L68_01045 [bacterium]|nr:hypothetical protein [bacterium]
MKKFPEPYSIKKRQDAIDLLEKNSVNGKPNFSKVVRETKITAPTLKRWWTKYQLNRQVELKTKLEEAITSILQRIESLAQETNNLKELAPIVKMLSELLQQVGEDTETGEKWG